MADGYRSHTMIFMENYCYNIECNDNNEKCALLIRFSFRNDISFFLGFAFFFVSLSISFLFGGCGIFSIRSLFIWKLMSDIIFLFHQTSDIFVHFPANKSIQFGYTANIKFILYFIWNIFSIPSSTYAYTWSNFVYFFFSRFVHCYFPYANVNFVTSQTI